MEEEIQSLEKEKPQEENQKEEPEIKTNLEQTLNQNTIEDKKKETNNNNNNNPPKSEEPKEEKIDNKPKGINQESLDEFEKKLQLALEQEAKDLK